RVFLFVYFFFFFQAEDGIRDRNVTGVQTCALPIFQQSANARSPMFFRQPGSTGDPSVLQFINAPSPISVSVLFSSREISFKAERSEERRVGKECRDRRSE